MFKEKLEINMIMSSLVYKPIYTHACVCTL